MPLDLSSLDRAVDSLDRATRVARSEIRGDVDTDREHVIRAGVVQNFEFTYELCWKFMKRWLEKNVGEGMVDGVTRRELFRIAAEHRLIEHIDHWFAYHESRNESAHTYDPPKARRVYETAFPFLADARSLLETLRTRND